MNDDQAKQNNLLDTTDCLEAIGVFRGWKNFLFAVAICCLLLLQVSFWLVDTGFIKTDEQARSDKPAALAKGAEQTNQVTEPAAADANEPNEAAPQPTEGGQPQKTGLRLRIKFKHLAWLIRFVNFVLILAASLYCLAMLFSLKVSLAGRLGGINHITRAFFLSLAFLVLLLPWQKFFAGVVVGAIYTPQELSSSYAAAEADGIFHATLYYLRFTGYWLLVLLLLIFSQLRSGRWSKAILHRLEVI